MDEAAPRSEFDNLLFSPIEQWSLKALFRPKQMRKPLEMIKPSTAA